MSVKQKMTALADEVRTLSGTTESKTVDDMTSDVGDANEVITSQALLISSIKSAIDNLPNAIPEDQYKDSSDLVVDGAKVITPAGYYPSDAEKSVKSVEAVFPTFEVTAEEETSEMWVRAVNTQAEGYVPLSTRFSDVFISLRIEGDTAIMSRGDQAIVRKMEGGGGGDLVDAIISGTAETLDSNTESVGLYACYYGSLKNVNLPNAKTIGNYAFSQNPLESISAPNVETIGNHTFSYTSLVEVSLPKLQEVYQNSFYQCASLKKADFASATSIGYASFAFCPAFETLILRRTDTVATVNANSLGSGTSANPYFAGYIYVPRSLVSSYKSATNWSKYSSKFRAIEDYPEITGG